MTRLELRIMDDQDRHNLANTVFMLGASKGWSSEETKRVMDDSMRKLERRIQDRRAQHNRERNTMKTALQKAIERCRPSALNAPEKCPECGEPLGKWAPVLVDPGLPTERDHPTLIERSCEDCEFREEHDRADDVPDRPGE